MCEECRQFPCHPACPNAVREPCFCAICGQECEPDELTNGVCCQCAEDCYTAVDAAEFIFRVGDKLFFEWRYNFRFRDVKNGRELLEDLQDYYFSAGQERAEVRDAVREYCLLPENRAEWTQYLKEEYGCSNPA